MCVYRCSSVCIFTYVYICERVDATERERMCNDRVSLFYFVFSLSVCVFVCKIYKLYSNPHVQALSCSTINDNDNLKIMLYFTKHNNNIILCEFCNMIKTIKLLIYNNYVMIVMR